MKLIIVDGHSDFGLKLLYEQQKGYHSVLRDNHLPQLRKGQVNLEVFNVGGDFDFYPALDPRDPLIVFQTLDSVLKEVSDNEDLFLIVKNIKDFEKISNSDKVGFLLALEGAGAIGSDFSRLRNFFRLGLRLITLTHNEQNSFADGLGVESPRGLTDLGKKFIHEMEEMGMILDLSHSSEPTFWDALNYSNNPVITSHSNAKTICNNIRNLSDDQIKAIGNKNGVIGINFVGQFIDNNPKNASIDRLIDHVDFIVDLIGIDHVGLGPDFLDYVVEDKVELFDTSSKDTQKEPVEMIYPKGLKTISDFPNLFMALEKRGYSQGDIKKIQGENFVRLYKYIFKN
ncbi:MAG: dipeptidase [Candidatus Lokiarchaeota archaeon]|nr:dipeptidase [Candidatus Lokiarchaeota archaeon]